jgi:hypothetical protein
MRRHPEDEPGSDQIEANGGCMKVSGVLRTECTEPSKTTERADHQQRGVDRSARSAVSARSVHSVIGENPMTHQDGIKRMRNDW